MKDENKILFAVETNNYNLLNDFGFYDEGHLTNQDIVNLKSDLKVKSVDFTSYMNTPLADVTFYDFIITFSDFDMIGSKQRLEHLFSLPFVKEVNFCGDSIELYCYSDGDEHNEAIGELITVSQKYYTITVL